MQRLTGGMLLSRNKDFLVYYRGKDFLSPDVAEVLLEKERLAKAWQDEEEQARLRASPLVAPSFEESRESGIAGTLKETLDADSRWGKQLGDDHKQKVMREAEVWRHANLVRKLDKKLAFVSLIVLASSAFHGVSILMEKRKLVQFFNSSSICASILISCLRHYSICFIISVN